MPAIFILEDLFKRTKVNNFYKKYLLFLKTDPSRITEDQGKKLKLLISHAYKNIPWYNSEMNRLGIKPEDIQSPNDISKFPILTREIINKHGDDLLWKGYRGKVFKSSSSGTTGIPITYYQDVNGYSAGVAAGYILTGFSGWIPGKRNVYIWGNRDSIKRWSTIPSRIRQFVYSKKNIPSTQFNDPSLLPSTVKEIIKHKPIFIDGYANSIYELAEYLKDVNIKLPYVKGVITTAENLEEFQNRSIEKSIAPVTDLYGCGEINGIACKGPGDEDYYIFEPHVLVESQYDEKSFMNDIIVTDLDNFYMPFIRYKVGDMIDGVKNGSSLNRYPFSYFTRIYGRTSDHIELPDGKKLFPVNMFGGTAFRKFKSIKRHKTIWDGEKIYFIFETDGNIDMILLENDIKNSLKDYTVDFEIQITDKLLPSESGKYRYFEVV